MAVHNSVVVSYPGEFEWRLITAPVKCIKMYADEWSSAFRSADKVQTASLVLLMSPLYAIGFCGSLISMACGSVLATRRALSSKQPPQNVPRVIISVSGLRCLEHVSVESLLIETKLFSDGACVGRIRSSTGCDIRYHPKFLSRETFQEFLTSLGELPPFNYFEVSVQKIMGDVSFMLKGKGSEDGFNVTVH